MYADSSFHDTPTNAPGGTHESFGPGHDDPHTPRTRGVHVDGTGRERPAICSAHDGEDHELFAAHDCPRSAGSPDPFGYGHHPRGLPRAARAPSAHRDGLPEWCHTFPVNRSAGRRSGRPHSPPRAIALPYGVRGDDHTPFHARSGGLRGGGEKFDTPRFQALPDPELTWGQPGDYYVHCGSHQSGDCRHCC